MTLKEKYYTFHKLTDQIEVAIGERHLILAAIIEEISPYKVGEIVLCKGSHSDKPGTIIEISGTIDYQKEIGIIVSADVLKKDGSKSAYRTNWKARNDPKLQAALSVILRHLDQNVAT